MAHQVPVHLTYLKQLISSVLSSKGLNLKSSESIASVVCDAERDGCSSHGLFRVPGYIHSLTAGGVKGDAEPIVSDAAPGLVTVDAQDGFAVSAFDAGAPMLISKAKSQGIASMAIHRGRHFSAVWRETEFLANHGLISLVFVNSAAFVAHSPGGSERVYGTNPMAFGCPRGQGKPPLVFDQASAAMARGEIQLLQREGLSLPPNVALDSNGNPTCDPASALSGAQLPMAGHKV
jgi:delta1-piperideine-2-carboxylate reductase